MHRLTILALGFFLLTAGRAFSVIIFDSGTSTTNFPYEVDPGDGSPWNYVAGIAIDGNLGGGASAVYVGNGFLLTANHVFVGGTNSNVTFLLNSGTFMLDTSFTPLQIGTADIKLLKLVGDPGLGSGVPLIGASDDDTNTASTIIGWGAGKGSVIPNQGWSWGDGSTHTERWGLNTTFNSTLTSGGTEYLITDFDDIVNEGVLTLGDSGGGLFQQFGATWKLAGINAGVETSGTSFYDKNPSPGPDDPDQNSFVRIQTYRDDILAVIVPEPGSLWLFAAGAALLLQRRSRAR